MTYPYQICLSKPPIERGWFPYVMSDACCVHSMLFAMRAVDEKPSNLQTNRAARSHYGRTLELLRTRLDDFNRTAAISDATIMAIVILALAAEIMNDLPTAANHNQGMQQIVKLRGGVKALSTHTNLHIKVCRADLAYALLSGDKPLLFADYLSWDCFIADQDLVRCSHQPQQEDFDSFIAKATEMKLSNAFKDVHALSCISNIAVQTGRKLSTETYNEMMISIFYRLMHLTFPDNALQEAIRMGLIVFSATVFMPLQYGEQACNRKIERYSKILYKLRQGSDQHVLDPIVMWLIMMLDAANPKGLSLPSWANTWLDEVIGNQSMFYWEQMHDTLRAIAWLDFIHNTRGHQTFAASLLRRQPP